MSPMFNLSHLRLQQVGRNWRDNPEDRPIAQVVSTDLSLSSSHAVSAAHRSRPWQHTCSRRTAGSQAWPVWVLVPPNQRGGGSAFSVLGINSFLEWRSGFNRRSVAFIRCLSCLAETLTLRPRALVRLQLRDSGERWPLRFPRHTYKLSRQLYSTLITQGTRPEILSPVLLRLYY